MQNIYILNNYKMRLYIKGEHAIWQKQRFIKELSVQIPKLKESKLTFQI